MATTASSSTRTRTEKGVSLARGPALILGTILEVAGLYFLYKQHGFPKFSNFPNGDAPVPGKVFLGIFGANGWTGLFTAAAGGLLLFGAAQHLLAKTMSLIVGLALGAAAVIAVISGNVLGLAAANNWTKLGWAVCAVILLFNTLIPRRTRTIEEPVADERPPARERVAPARDTEPVTRTQAADTEPVTRTQAADSEPVTRTQAADSEPVTRTQAADSEPVTRTQAADSEPVTRTQAADSEPVTRTQAADSEPVTHADGDADQTEPLVTRDPGATRVQRTGPMDDREAGDETSRREPLSE
jgi:hypothetical protein